VIYPPDEVLLPELSKQLARPESSLFIALHVFGSHSPYVNRYPKSFDKFGAQALDTYDDAILYTDWFLEQVIELVRRVDVPATVTYVSDHGEDLYALDGRSGHGLGDYSPHAFDIPAFVWMNDAYRELHPDKARALIDNAHKRIRSHDFFYTEADLMGIQWSGAVPQRSFASPLFSPDLHDRFVAGGNLVAGAD
jgi:glucan phosphoethanolaminetransferase (alkaline phosphatase superfamily)